MSSSIRENFIYNIINTVCGLLFPLVTYPYAFRILTANGIGIVNFLNSIISYIVLLTSLGIPLYGIRETARVRDNPRELTRTTIEIISLNLFLNIIGYLIVFILCLTIPEIKELWGLFILLSTSIIFTTLGCQWFYSGIEDFKYITIRGLIVRIACTVFLFLVVKSKNDLYWYALYTVLITSGNYIINFICLKNKISVKSISISELNILKHIKPASAVFIFSLITSIYLNLDKVMLGFMQDAKSVGYYTASSQIAHILITIVAALGAVMLPRSSNLIKLGKFEDFYRLLKKAYYFIIMLAMPLCIGCFIMAPVLIHVFCGSGYDPAIQTLRILCPIIIALGVSNLIGLQMLYPMDLIKLVTFSTCIGATINFTLNVLLIPLFSQDGAAIASVAAECSVTITQIILAKKYIKFYLFSKQFFLYLGASIIMGSCCYLVLLLGFKDIINLIFTPILGMFIYIFILSVFKDKFIIELRHIITSKLKI